MEKLYLEEIAKATGGRIVFGNPEVYAESVVIDSRKAKPNSLFIGISGENVDGNDYMLSAFEQGASIAMIEKNEDMLPANNKGLIEVDSTKEALVKLSKYYKERLKAKFVVVTGSTGKTTVKDMLHGMLSKKYKVFKTQGNYNNELGLPLMLLSMDSTYDIAVLEMGMSSLGEINFLSEIVRQNAALITNIGVSHIEMLKTRDNIFKAKMEVTDFFKADDTLYVNSDDEYLKNVSSDKYRVVKSGIKSGDFKAENIELGQKYVEFDIVNSNINLGRIKINAPGMHNISNGILAYSCAYDFGITLDMIRELDFDRTAMRLQEYKFENVTVINDAYNSSPDSMRAGLDILETYKGRKVALLGDMKELGDMTFVSHKECGVYARKKADKLIAVGNENKSYMAGFGSEDFYGYRTFEEAAKVLPVLLKKGDVVYLKASRTMEFERFLEILERF